MGGRRDIANANDVGRIACIALQDGCVGFKLIQYNIFDLCWSDRRSDPSLHRSANDAGTDRDCMPLNSTARLRFPFEVPTSTTGIKEITLHSKPISSMTFTIDSTRLDPVTMAEADFPTRLTEISDTPSSSERASVIDRTHATQVIPPTASRTVIFPASGT